MVYKAVTHLKLDHGNAGKIKRLDDVTVHYQRTLQFYSDWLVENEQKKPNKFQDMPAFDTPLSTRWRRCCWFQACGLIAGWYANKRENKPVIKAVAIQANVGVVLLEKSKDSTFDYWLRISTLQTHKTVRIPIRLHDYAKKVLAQYPDVCSSVTLVRKTNGTWYLTLFVKVDQVKPEPTEVIGIDVGMVKLATTSKGKYYGDISPELTRKTEQQAVETTRRQRLNNCLKKKGLVETKHRKHKAADFCRNEIGKALNQLVRDLPDTAAVAVENLAVADMRMKSRAGNRRLRAAQLGYLRDRLQYKLAEQGFHWEAVQPAYSSQQCSQCGFVSRENRKSQAAFKCIECGHAENADVQAARTIAKRFGDQKLNGLDFRHVKALLELRFRQGHPDGCSPSAGPDTACSPSAQLISAF
jgi:IS605 OrfB family transposase